MRTGGVRNMKKSRMDHRSLIQELNDDSSTIVAGKFSRTNGFRKEICSFLTCQV